MGAPPILCYNVGMQNIDELIHPSAKGAPQKLQAKMAEISLREKEVLAQELAYQLSLPYVNLIGFPIGPEVLRLIPEAIARQAQLIAFFNGQGQLRLATSNPENPDIHGAVADLQHFFPNSRIVLYVVSEHSFQKALDLYKNVAKIKITSRDLKITEADIKKYQAQITALTDLNKILTAVNTSDFFIILLAAAINFSASDIHLETAETDVKIRFRLDGVLQEAAALPLNLWKRIINRIKEIAHLKINITDQPQDGRLTIKYKNEEVDVRVSTLPSAYGVSSVISLVHSPTANLDLNVLGISPYDLRKIITQSARPNGMVIITGPTGSGKTTTLYSILNKLNKQSSKIITLEDPIEYRLAGITQSQVDLSKEYTFAKGLRSILRQDPDIVMVGEIRDAETADTAVQAALTGHLLLSTVHTNNAAGAIPRLLSLGVKPFLLAPALNAVVGQRLVRKICPQCKVEQSLDAETLEKAKNILSKITNPEVKIDLANLKFYKGQGCPKCQGIGYQGRLGIFEIFSIDRNMEAVILSNEASEYTVRDAAVSQGMTTMVQDGLLKALNGITTVEEVFRVTE